MASASHKVLRVVRASRGDPAPEDFSIGNEPLPQIEEGEVLARTIYMSVDAGMKSKLPFPGMESSPHFVALGGVMHCGRVPPLNGYTGGTVSVVVESRHPDFAPGDFVQGGQFVQEYQVERGQFLAKIPKGAERLPAYLGPLGRSGFAAWIGVRLIADIKPGETFVISGAGGPIGQIAGQFAKLAGARVIGIASGAKCGYVVEELGFDACIDRKSEDVGARLDALCPEGVNVYFDSVGGEVGKSVFDRLAKFGRMVLCGLAAEYGGEIGSIPKVQLLAKSLRVQGFVIYDHFDYFERFTEETLALLQADKIRFQIRMMQGMESFSEALRQAASGESVGKLILQLSPDPTAEGG